MKKINISKSIVLVLIIFVSIPVKSQNAKDIIGNELYGRVKSVRMHYLDPYTEDRISNGLKSNLYETLYDKKGNTIEINKYDFSGNLVSSEKNNYEKIRKGNTPPIPPENKNIKSEKETDKKTFDQFGNIIEQIFYDDNNKISMVFKCQYDDAQNLIEENILIYSDGDYRFKGTDKYDSWGNIIEKSQYDTSDNLMFQYLYEYQYDKKNNWVKKIGYGVRNDTKQITEITVRTIKYYR